MSLKLFRHTDYAQSILSPGETRFALHPGWAVLALSVWVGFVCNPWFWHALASGSDLGRAVMLGAVIAGGAAFLLSLFGWRRTFKTVATFMLLAAALLAAGAWTQGVTLASVLESQRAAFVLPTWASFFGWQVPVLLGLLGFLPMLWVWNAHLRRLTGSKQLAANITGMVLAAVVIGGALFAMPMAG
jgi:glucan phosphoethanolaminetransferase (alkaline phosphatase superfamily)